MANNVLPNRLINEFELSWVVICELICRVQRSEFNEVHLLFVLLRSLYVIDFETNSDTYFRRILILQVRVEILICLLHCQDVYLSTSLTVPRMKCFFLQYQNCDYRWVWTQTSVRLVKLYINVVDITMWCVLDIPCRRRRFCSWGVTGSRAQGGRNWSRLKMLDQRNMHDRNTNDAWTKSYCLFLK